MYKRFTPSLVVGAALLIGPSMAFAATAKTTDDVSQDELMEILNAEEAVPMPATMDRGGGYGSSIMYPGPYGYGVTVDASITKEVTPDYIALNAYCDIQSDSREQTRAELQRVFEAIKAAVGSDGRVRRQGSYSVYPMYGGVGEETGRYSGNLSVFIRIANKSATVRIANAVEANNCGVNWDVRLTDMQSFEMDVLDDLSTRLDKRKQVFEKLLGKRLTTISAASINTWVDGYSSYDPETNKADATTTLSVTYDLGSRATITPPVPATRERLTR